jgi:alkanesulfonate monooxygenase SsuD/methylene tetrahydromethanopterin reductase-like flavin-dependent oxidoreductase (luciferase family)
MTPTLQIQLSLSTSRPLHLAVALEGAGWHPSAWREPGARPDELFSARYWTDLVREAADGLLDLVTIEDSHRLPEGLPGDSGGRVGQVRGRLDAIMIAARVAPVTRHVGIVPAASTVVSEPFLLSTQIATLDFASRGRAGWLAQVESDPRDAGYVGPRAVPEGLAVLDEAADYVEVVRQLWDSWADDAEIRDAVSHRFFDRSRVHRIDFAGKYFRVTGPSITPRPPQGQPIVAMLAPGGARSVVASFSADVLFVRRRDELGLRDERESIDDALCAVGREPPTARVLADVVVYLDQDGSQAAERKLRLDALDGERHDPDALVFTGTPAQLADQLLDWRALGYDGFRLLPAATAHDLRAVTRSLVPELQRRGAFRTGYEAETLRGLLGLGRPDSRYAPRVSAGAAAP